jgi:hypothetical protein
MHHSKETIKYQERFGEAKPDPPIILSRGCGLEMKGSAGLSECRPGNTHYPGPASALLLAIALVFKVVRLAVPVDDFKARRDPTTALDALASMSTLAVPLFVGSGAGESAMVAAVAAVVVAVVVVVEPSVVLLAAAAAATVEVAASAVKSKAGSDPATELDALAVNSAVANVIRLLSAASTFALRRENGKVQLGPNKQTPSQLPCRRSLAHRKQLACRRSAHRNQARNSTLQSRKQRQGNDRSNSISSVSKQRE